MHRHRFLGALALVGCTEASAPPPVSVPPPPTGPTSSTQIGPPPAPEAPPPAPRLVVEGAPAPAKHPIDPNQKVDVGLFLGASSTEIWLLIDDHYTVVIDRATGCATEGYAQPKNFKQLHSDRGSGIDEALKDPATLQGIRDMVGVGRRTGALGNRFMLDMVWSPDGVYIAFEAEGRMYLSRDGGKSFQQTGNQPRSRLAMSDDGKYLTYEEGRQYFSVPNDFSRAPLPLTKGQTFLAQMRPGAKAFYWRSDSQEMCADIFDLATAQLSSSTCLPVPAAAKPVPPAKDLWPSRQWESISPNGKYGIVKWEERRKNLAGVPALTYVLALVEMATKTTIKTVLDMQGEVDDGGNMVMSSMNEGGGDHTYYYPFKGDRKLLGKHTTQAWHDKTAIMAVSQKGTLGQHKCDLVKLVKTP